MIKLKLDSLRVPLHIKTPQVTGIESPIIFYLVNNKDERPFFITYVICDFSKNELLYLFSYRPDNVQTMINCDDSRIYSMYRCPHKTLSINQGEDFITFMEEEAYFTYVNYKKMEMHVYTMKDLLPKSHDTYTKISSTFFKDPQNPDCFYLSAVDTNNILHIFCVSLALDKCTEITSYPSHPNPPHVLRRYKDYLLLSHDFKYSTYKLLKQNKIVTDGELGQIIVKQAMRILLSDKNYEPKGKTSLKSLTSQQIGVLFKRLEEKYAIRCLPGKVSLYDMNLRKNTYYNTNGGSPAHFEIDDENETIYTSSHNFFVTEDSMTFLEPAVIDKLKLTDGKLHLTGSFSYDKGFRYTSHKIFNNNGRTYMCAFGQPNRLIFVDTCSMELLFYDDIENDELTGQDDVFTYINTRSSKFEIVAVEVTADGETIIFVGLQYIYLYSFSKRKIIEKINYMEFSGKNDQLLRTVHLDFLS